MTKIKMYESRGNVLSIQEFVDEYIDKANLSQEEKDLLKSADLQSIILEPLEKPLTRAEWLKKKESPELSMKRAGQRSAFWEEKRIKFKGCNPPEEKRMFPTELTFFGKEEVIVESIPFGILTAEQAIREILGHVFFLKHDLATNIKPICIYTQGYGFCLVEETKAETRLESFLDYDGLDVSRLVEHEQFRRKIGLSGCLGTEIRLKGINIAKYSYEKAKILVSMNFNGGFRGLLNSNIGNDVIQKNKDGIKLFLCDFDTFAMVQVPKEPTEEFLKRFVLQSFVELAKSSLPIIDLVEDSKEAVEKYRKISSLYTCYQREFYNRASDQGWDVDKLKEIEEWAVSTPIFRRTVCEIVPTYKKIKMLPERKPMYKTH